MDSIDAPYDSDETKSERLNRRSFGQAQSERQVICQFVARHVRFYGFGVST